MNIHEYQAKKLMGDFNIPTLKGNIARTADEAVKAAKEIGGSIWVVKAQIHAGGRGKGGGVKLARSLDEVKKYASEIIGMNLVTHQTGPEGKRVNLVLIEEGCAIDHEYYLGIVLDRRSSMLTIMGSSEGGMDIEEVAHKSPEKIIKIQVDPAVGFTPYMGRQMVYSMGMDEKFIKPVSSFIQGLYEMYLKLDLSTVEINPLVTTKDGKILALDAKINFDDNALFRHPELEALRDLTEESSAELEAKEFGLSYISLDGNIGCLVNGAGLAMATMDIIKLHGGTPANFLDVGGGASKEAVEKAFTIILRDEKVKAILVNIFGGIMKCDIIAEGIIAAVKSLQLKVPLVVRLEGTNVDLAKKILAQSQLAIVSASDLSDAAEKVVNLSQGRGV
ncbi:MAG: ADP-forming succinate--CoA ligase subunit beta [Bacteriovoracaceae bacterium]|nr:ADP-forming succinate--CoA ligase subunit beta [Bacteriovoracaceae bacterium]